MRLPVSLIITIAATTPTLAHQGVHVHPHGGGTIGLGLAALALAGTVAAASLPHLPWNARRRRDRD